MHSDNHKLRILNSKINVDLIQTTNSSINLKLSNTPVTLNYYDALTSFRNQVNQKFAPELSSSKNIRTRRVNEVGHDEVSEVVFFKAEADNNTVE